jgi:hypothetical protein
VFYLYPRDPDSRRQDAMKIVIPAESADLPTQVILPIGSHHPKNLLVTWDIWWGSEFNYAHAGILRYKGVPQFGSPDERIWTSLHTDFPKADLNKHNLPPGGPYVTMTYPHSSAEVSVKSPFTRGGVNSRLPYGAPSKEQRNYGGEMVGPLDTSVRPEGMEFGVVAETWTRYWAFFERDEANDWDVTSPPAPASQAGRMRAYKWSVWAADENREPVRIINDVIISPHPKSGGWQTVRIEMDISNEEIPAGRGPLVAYTRNYVVLHGTRKADVLAMLQKPVR